MAKTFMDGRVHVRKRQCSTCIFTDRKPVEQERVDQMIRDADADDSCIPCHHHLYLDQAIEPVCRGYFDRKSSATLRLAEAMEIVTFVDGLESTTSSAAATEAVE